MPPTKRNAVCRHPGTRGSISRAGLAVALLLAAATNAGASEPLRLKLPFPAGTTFQCAQGNDGVLTHADARNRFAYDFAMPEGTPVLAAAAGRVVWATDADTQPGSLTPEAMERGNGVRIDHGDGRFTVYGHLQPHSLQVRPGQLVSAAQFLARSGNTGYSGGPHLHFGVTDCVQTSIPSAFLDVPENGGIPTAGMACTSGNDGVGMSWFLADSTLPLDAFASDGITLLTTVPAAYWNRFEPYTLRGAVAGEARTVCFFLSGLRPTPMECTQLDGHSAFSLNVRIADFGAPVEGLECVRVGLTVPKGGVLPGEVPLALALWDHDFDSTTGRIVAPLRLPFALGSSFRYVSASGASTDRTGCEVSVTCFVPPGTPVLACGAGRVVAIDAQEPSEGESDVRSAPEFTITIDHGDGVLTEYAGIQPDPMAVRLGEIVREGRRLGVSARASSPGQAPVHLRVFARPEASRPRFAQLGPTQLFAESGTAECSTPAERAHVFRADSAACASEFPGSGITEVTGLPARTFHAHTTYRAEGTVDAAAASVNFVVRRRGAKTERRVGTGWVRDGAFAFSTRLGDVDEFADGQDGEWTLRVTSIELESAPLVWLPLVIVR